jgi:hypothetical protein
VRGTIERTGGIKSLSSGPNVFTLGTGEKDEHRKEEIIKSFFVNILYDFHAFDTWREDLVRKRASEAARRG